MKHKILIECEYIIETETEDKLFIKELIDSFINNNLGKTEIRGGSVQNGCYSIKATKNNVLKKIIK